jgi:hypothetical protein
VLRLLLCVLAVAAGALSPFFLLLRAACRSPSFFIIFFFPVLRIISIADGSRQCRALTGISFSTLAADCRVFSFLSSFFDLFLRSPRTLCFDPLFLLLLLLLVLLLLLRFFFPSSSASYSLSSLLGL